LLDDGKINTDWKVYIGNTAQGAITGTALGFGINPFVSGFAGGTLGDITNQLITTGQVDVAQSLVSGATTSITSGVFSLGGQVTSTGLNYVKDYAAKGFVAGMVGDSTYQILNGGIVRNDYGKSTGYNLNNAIQGYNPVQALKSGVAGAIMAPIGAKIVETAIDKWGLQSGTRTVEVNGKKVMQDDKLIDPNQIDSKTGLTNRQLMEQGKAPIGPDGNKINIHHVNQTDDGPVMEITSTDHQQNNQTLHTNTGQSPSQINRSEFDKWRNEYWKIRGNTIK
jgi:hypothetical protein